MMRSDNDARRLVVIYLRRSCLGTQANLSGYYQIAQSTATPTSPSVGHWFQVLLPLPFTPHLYIIVTLLLCLFRCSKCVQTLFPQSLDANHAKIPKRRILKEPEIRKRIYNRLVSKRSLDTNERRATLTSTNLLVLGGQLQFRYSR